MINFVIMRQLQQTTQTIRSFKRDEWFNSLPHKGESVIIDNQQYIVINVLYICKLGNWEANVVLMSIEDFESQNNINYGSGHGGMS